ncbi:MAG: hypothetical protein A2W91_11165 [Bacteroidetes bacterium GWF2_38_335]|nr:MAG: hypothetical protein A2W91_11165 [Bacteroidetes bacterium GWF2_38_335]OFY81743.1 MAG: hypothetical protein A2281_05875 [Bacteroidetes bacterium RIFOXYA12_FULL_38_20]HBS87808.1 DUF5063 domain-containing protein [Bacteroidales bacterium]
MEEESGSVVYSKNAIEFVTVASEYCKMIESIDKMPALIFLSQAQKILPLLYLKASLIPYFDQVLDEPVEKIFSESDWSYIQMKITAKLENFEWYFDYQDPFSMVENDIMQISVSEVFTDIYQDLSDLIHLYQLGNEEIMNDALWECKNAFENYWGKRLIGLMEQIHIALYSDIPGKTDERFEKKDTDNWLISKRMKDLRGDDV